MEGSSNVSKKSKWFMGGACFALLVGLTRVVPSLYVGADIADFSSGLGVALMFGALVFWNDQRVR